jgi:8-oxo-dGTP diphosphatase
MKEFFAKPAVSAIIEKDINGEKYILVQRRQKEDGNQSNGLLEVAGGKIREYENIFDALRREVLEETGLNVIKIYGEGDCVSEQVGCVNTINFNPFCVTQNLNGIYSLIMMTFICCAEGEPAIKTNESTDIRWAKIDEIEKMVEDFPETIFPMDIVPLKKYIRLQK